MEEVNSTTEPAVEQTSAVEPTQTPRPAVERKFPSYRLHVKWPGYAEKKLWETVNEDLTLSLEKL